MPGFRCRQIVFQAAVASVFVASCFLSNSSGDIGAPVPTPSECDPAGITVLSDPDDGEKWRVIRSHGLADHSTGTFPNRKCPNSIAEQCYYFKIPYIEEHGTSMPVPGSPFELELPARFGVALNGVVFDPLANDFYNPSTPNRRSPPDAPDANPDWRYNASHPLIHDALGLDEHNAHPQDDDLDGPSTSGAYHYHADPGVGGTTLPELIGWAFDGYPIYGSACGRLSTGPVEFSRAPITQMHSGWGLIKARTKGPGGDPPPLSETLPYGKVIELPLGVFDQDWVYVGGELDECNGHSAPTPEFPDGSYHYHVTQEFPCVPRCHRLLPTEK